MPPFTILRLVWKSRRTSIDPLPLEQEWLERKHINPGLRVDCAWHTVEHIAPTISIRHWSNDVDSTPRRQCCKDCLDEDVVFSREGPGRSRSRLCRMAGRWPWERKGASHRGHGHPGDRARWAQCGAEPIQGAVLPGQLLTADFQEAGGEGLGCPRGVCFAHSGSRG